MANGDVKRKMSARFYEPLVNSCICAFCKHKHDGVATCDAFFPEEITKDGVLRSTQRKNTACNPERPGIHFEPQDARCAKWAEPHIR